MYEDQAIGERDYIPPSNKYAHQAASAQAYKGQLGVDHAKAAAREESLATVAPRVINLSETVHSLASSLESSFGISVPSKDGIMPDGAPVLLSQLTLIEDRLQATARALENVLRHVNG